MKKIVGMLLTAALAAFTASAQTVLEEWTFNAETNGTSFTNLVNTGTEGLCNLGEDHFGTYVQDGVLRFTDAATNDCFRVGEMTTSGLNSGVYELSWTYTHAQISVNNSAFGIYLRSKETYSPVAGKNSTDLFQFRLQCVSGVLKIQTRVMDSAGLAGIINHLDMPSTTVDDVQVKLKLDLNNDTMSGTVIHAGATNTFSRTILDLPADYIRVHGTSTALGVGHYVAIDDIRWSYVEEGDIKDVILINYEMNDDLNTEINALLQTGVEGGHLSGTNSGIRADGLGNLVYTNLTSDQYSAINLGSAITSGVVELEYRLSEWDTTLFDTNDKIYFELRDSATQQGLQLSIDQNAFTRINYLGTTDKPRELLTVSSGSNLTVKVQINMDAGTFAAFYNLGDGWVLKAKDQLLGATVLNQFRLVGAGSPWAAGPYVKVDYVRVTLPTAKKLIDYGFADAAGTDLKDLWQNGTITNNWDFNKTGEAFADGTGNLTLTNSTGWTRKLSFTNAPLSTGVVTLDYRLDSWDLQNLGASEGVVISLGDTGAGTTVKSKFFLTATVDDARMTMTDSANVGKQKAGFGLASGAEGVSFRLVNDLDAETFRGYYKLDSETDWTEITTTNTAGLATLDEIILVADAWSGGGYIDIDSLMLRRTVGESVEPTVEPNITSYSIAGSTVTLVWDSESGIRYNVLSKASLSDATWSTKAGAIDGAGASTTTDVPASGASEFYRIEAYAP